MSLAEQERRSSVKLLAFMNKFTNFVLAILQSGLERDHPFCSAWHLPISCFRDNLIDEYFCISHFLFFFPFSGDCSHWLCCAQVPWSSVLRLLPVLVVPILGRKVRLYVGFLRKGAAWYSITVEYCDVSRVRVLAYVAGITVHRVFTVKVCISLRSITRFCLSRWVWFMCRPRGTKSSPSLSVTRIQVQICHNVSYKQYFRQPLQ